MWKRSIVALILVGIALGSVTGAGDVRVRHDASSPVRGAWNPTWAALPLFKSTTNRDGLPQSSVTSMAFDRDGFLWVGTQDGAAVSNTLRWTTVNMPNRTTSNFVRAIAAADDGSVWFGTREGGVSRFLHGQWTTYTTDNGLPNNRVRALATSPAAQGAAPVVWASTDAGLARFDGIGWTAVVLPPAFLGAAVLAILPIPSRDEPNAIWVGSENGTARFQAGLWTVFRTPEGLPATDVRSLGFVTGSEGLPVVCAGTSNGIATFNGTRFDPVSMEGARARDAQCVCELRPPNGSPMLWIGTSNGISCLQDGAWRNYGTTEGLPGDRILSLAADTVSGMTRSLFVGALGGLAQLDLGEWSSLDRRAGLPSNLVYAIRTINEPNGSNALWIGTESGLACYDKSGLRVFRRRDGLPDDAVLCLAESPDRVNPTLLLGTRSGIGIFRNGAISSLPGQENLSNREIRCLHVAQSDLPGDLDLWVGTLGGAVHVSRGIWRTYSTEDGLPSNSVVAIAETTDAEGRRTVWAATYGGLARLVGDRWETVAASSGLPPGDVICVYPSLDANGHRTLWVGTGDNGVAKVDLDDPAGKWMILNDSTMPALPNNVVYDIREDALRRIYLLTNRGVARLSPASGSEPGAAPYDVTTFSTEDGLPNSEGNAGASFVDASGRIWVGTVEGAAVFDPSAEVVSRTPSPLRLTRAVLGSGAALTSGTEIPYDDSNLLLEYALLDFVSPHTALYRTQLEGLDDGPGAWSSETRKEYTNLPAGAYTFRVWAKDREGIQSTSEVVAFTVRPAPWRTWWAYFLYAATIAALGYAALRLRFRSLQRNNVVLEERIDERTTEIADKVRLLEISERKALSEKQRAIEANRAKTMFLANMSHELRTPLNAIMGFVQLMERSRTRSPEDRENLAVISRSSENLLALILDLLTVSRLESGNTALDEHAFDLYRLLRGVEEMFGVEAHGRGLHMSAIVDQDVPRYVWGDENKLRQILIKVLGNALKFTARGSVTLVVAWTNSRARFLVEDTGRGIPQGDVEKIFEPFVQSHPDSNNPQGAGLGLTIARSFSRLMGGDMLIQSEHGEGTRVIFNVRLPLASGVEVEREMRRVVGLGDGQEPVKVLVVDDVAENRVLLMRMLETVGIETREAASAREALVTWQSWMPDFVWMDTRMPEMGGLEATREIRRRESSDPSRRRTVVVATTTSAFEDDRAEIVNAGCDDYIAVPATEYAVFEKLSSHLSVTYVYEEAQQDDDQPYTSDVTITPAFLATLPGDLMKQLHRAVMEGDVAQAMDVANLVSSHDDRLATALRAMIRGYRFDELQELIENRP